MWRQSLFDFDARNGWHRRLPEVEKTSEPHRFPNRRDAPHRLLHVAGFRVGATIGGQIADRKARRERSRFFLCRLFRRAHDEQFWFSATDKLLVAAARRRSIERHQARD